MTILWCSNDMADWSGVVKYTSSAYRDTTRVPYAMSMNDTNMYRALQDHAVPSGTTVWYHAHVRGVGAATAAGEDGYVATVYDDSDNALARWALVDGKLAVEVSGDGSTFETKVAHVTQTLSGTLLQFIDLKVDVTGSDVTATLYHDGVEMATDTVTNSASLGVPSRWDWTLNDAHPGNGITFSEFIVADVDTRGMRLSMLQPTTAGDNTDWSGAVADLADDDASTGMTSDTATDRQSMNFDTYNGGDSIVAVIPVAQIALGANAPTKAQVGVRISSTDYDGTDTTLAGYRTRVEEVFLLDPSDSGAWTAVKVNACQLQIEAVA